MSAMRYGTAAVKGSIIFEVELAGGRVAAERDVEAMNSKLDALGVDKFRWELVRIETVSEEVPDNEVSTV